MDHQGGETSSAHYGGISYYCVTQHILQDPIPLADRFKSPHCRKKFNLVRQLIIYFLRHCNCQYCRCTSDLACRGCALAMKLLLGSLLSIGSSKNPDMPQDNNLELCCAYR